MSKVIVHIGSDHINERVGQYGALLHYARIEDAAARHQYVRSGIYYSVYRLDFLGKRFVEAPVECSE